MYDAKIYKKNFVGEGRIKLDDGLKFKDKIMSTGLKRQRGNYSKLLRRKIGDDQN